MPNIINPSSVNIRKMDLIGATGTFDLKKFVDKKYGAANINATHHYEDTDGYQVDSTAPTASAITNFKHEETVNDAKRMIRVIQPRYIDLVVDEFKRLMATQ